MTKKLLFLTFLLVICIQIFGQHLGLTFQDAEKHGVTIKYLDSIYKSAVHIDTSKAVFKTDSAQETFGKAYTKLLQDFGKYLTENNFKWDKKTKCSHRIYFNYDGTINYFLFNFLGNPEDKPSEEKQKEYSRLLNLFINDYKISQVAKTKFVQCGSASYMPN